MPVDIIYGYGVARAQFDAACSRKCMFNAA
jgi:hypothetical protein